MTEKKLSPRDAARLKALQAADKALYELWKQSDIYSQEMYAINNLQKKFIHPAIKKLEGR